MTITADRALSLARDARPIVKATNKHGTIYIAEGYHHNHPQHTIGGVIVPGWYVLWIFIRDGTFQPGTEMWGEFWAWAHTSQEQRVAEAMSQAAGAIKLNVELGRYA